MSSKRYPYCIEKILSILLFILLVALLCMYAWLYYSVQTMVDGFASLLTKVSGYVRLFAFLILINFIFLLGYLRRYLSIFDLVNIKIYLNVIIFCICSLLALLLLKIIYTYLLITLLIVFSVLSFIVGWKLVRFKGDYIGGLSVLGYCMCISAVVIPLWMVVPLLLYNIFDKAGKNIENQKSKVD